MNIFEKFGFSSSKEVKEKREKVLDLIGNLDKQLSGIKGKEGLENIVYFLQTISNIKENLDTETKSSIENYLNKKNKEAKEKFIDLYEQIQGILLEKDKFGMIRAQKGEEITGDNVYFGNIDGLFTKNVNFWFSKKGENKGGFNDSNMEDKNSFDVINNQIKGIIEKPLNSIIEDSKIISQVK